MHFIHMKKIILYGWNKLIMELQNWIFSFNFMKNVFAQHMSFDAALIWN